MLDYIRAFGRLNRDVKLYLAAFGLAAFGYFGIMGVLFNLYLARLGFDAAFIGLLIASGQLVWAALALPAGAIGLRQGLTRALLLAQVLITVGFSLVLLVEWLPRPLWASWLVGGWMILWLGVALFTVNSLPFLMAATSPSERGHAFALQSAIIALLALAGSLVAGWLPGALAGWLGVTLDDPAPYRLALWLAPLTFGLATLLMAALRPMVAAGKEDEVEQRAGAPMGLFVFLTVTTFLAACGEGAARSFFNLYLDSDLQVETAQIGAAMGVSQLLPVLVALFTPLLLARLGSGLTLAAATTAAALCLAWMGLAPQWLAATAALMGIQGTMAVIGPARNLFCQEMVAARWRTTTSALATVGLALGWAVAAALGGYTIEAVGYGAFFLVCASLTLASALLLFVYVWRTPAVVAPLPADAQVAGD
jgi:MFS family permease